MGFLEHFDIFVERETVQCSNTTTCTTISIKTKETSMNYKILKSGHDDRMQHPATPTSGKDTSSFPRFC